MATDKMNDILMLLSTLYDEQEPIGVYQVSGMLQKFGTKASNSLRIAFDKLDKSKIPSTGKEASDRLAEQLSRTFMPEDFDFETGGAPPLTAEDVRRFEVDSKAKSIWESSVVEYIKGELPPHIDSLPTHIVNWLKENFMFTKSGDNRNICYFRNKDMPGRCWQEVGYISQNGTAHVFSCLHGKLREELVHELIRYGEADYCDVYSEDKVETNVPKYKLWLPVVNRYIESCKDAEAQKYASKYLGGIIDRMKRYARGELDNTELSRGLCKVDEILAQYDEFGQRMEAFWKDKIHLPSLTNDPEEDALHYYALDNISEGNTPVFDMLLSGVVECCQDSLMAMVWATFYARSHMQKYVWLHGEGGDGKSVFVRTMMDLLGSDIASALTAETLKSEFGLENVVGRRMLLIPDLKTGISVKKAFIHNITGGDPVSVNRKNKPVITTVLDPILWITANDAPEVDFSLANESRRLVYIKFQQPPMAVLKKICKLDKNGNPMKDEHGHYIKSFDMAAGLKKEWDHVLWRCKEAYDRLNFNDTELVVSPEENQLREENCIDDRAGLWDRILDKICEKTDNYDDYVDRSEFFKKVDFQYKIDGKGKPLDNFDKKDIGRHLVNRGVVMKQNHGYPVFRYLKLK